MCPTFPDTRDQYEHLKVLMQQKVTECAVHITTKPWLKCFQREHFFTGFVTLDQITRRLIEMLFYFLIQADYFSEKC